MELQMTLETKTVRNNTRGVWKLSIFISNLILRLPNFAFSFRISVECFQCTYLVSLSTLTVLVKWGVSSLMFSIVNVPHICFQTTNFCKFSIFWFFTNLTWSFQNKPLILFEPFFDYYNDVAVKMELRVNLFW